MNNPTRKLKDTAVSVLLHISMWQPRRGSRKAIKRGAEDSKLIHAALHSDEFRRIQALNKKVRRYHADWTWPWQGNFVLLPVSRYDDYAEMMADFMVQYENATEDFAKLIDGMKATAKTDAFPTGKYIRTHNQVTVAIFPALLEGQPHSSYNEFARTPAGMPIPQGNLGADEGIRDRIDARNLAMLEAGAVTRLRNMLTWMGKQAEPEAVEHLIAYSEKERHRYIRWCRALLEFNILSPMHQDIVQQTLTALQALPDSVELDEKQHQAFFLRIKDLQTLLLA